jgi:hypothetical protein
LNSLSTQRDVKAVVKRFGCLVATAMLVIAVAGCAAMKPQSPEEAVRERAQARWDALVKGDVKAAYAFLSPGSRAVMTSESYASSIRVGFWKSAQVNRVACENPEKCEAQATIEYEYNGQRLKAPVREVWIRERTDWWYVQK